jgi:hypothetical protein
VSWVASLLTYPLLSHRVFSRGSIILVGMVGTRSGYNILLCIMSWFCVGLCPVPEYTVLKLRSE